jgi:hypothetical protein
MKTIVKASIISGVMTLLLGVATVAPATPAYAAGDDDTNTAQCNPTDGTNVGVRSGLKCTKTAEQKGNLGNVIEQVTNVLLFIIGAVSVIMIIIGGIKYTISNGDSSQITSAKNTILYAVIGLVVALLAYAIVNFVLDSFMANPGGGSSQTKTQ